MYRKYQSQDASITVFLSLVLILILSLIMTVIEGARQSTARVFAERAFITSMDSVLAEFYGPLMAEYHLLGLDASYGEDISQDWQISQRMQDYMSYSLNPKQGLTGASSRLNLYGISLESVDIKNKTSLMDYQGEIFNHQVIEYMKYKELKDVVEFFLEKASILEQPKKVSVLYNEKVKLEEQLVAIDEGILALMKYIDGVSTGKKGLIRGKDYKLKTEPYFAKKIIYGVPTMESTGINNQAVFLALQDQYVDPSESFLILEERFDRLEDIHRIIEDLENRILEVYEEIDYVRKSLKLLQEALANAKKDDKADTSGLEESINNMEQTISNLEDVAESIRANIKVYRDEERDCINTISTIEGKLSLLVDGCLSAVERAIPEVEKIIKTSEEAEPIILSYEKSLQSEKGELNEDIYESLEQGLEELKRYQLNNKEGYNFPLMKEILEKNYEILKDCSAYINEGYQAFFHLEISRAKNKYKQASEKLLSYKISGLNINYSSLVIEKENTPDFLDGMTDLIKKGIVGLVIDTDIISTNEISEDMLPSTIASLLDEEESFSFSSLLKNMNMGGKDSGMGDLFSRFNDINIGSLLGSSANMIIEGVLVQEYIKDHFYSFPVNDNDMEKRKPSALNYEWEYILCGHMSDKENLQDVILKLILIRTLLNFTSILGDKEKWNESKIIATALVGFTGLPILVAITQGILMIILAIASALVDTCALLMGKEIAILKKQVDLNFAEILILTKERIESMAKSYKNEKGFSYNDYLTLFLYLTNKKDKSYRMMDLVQENINLRYGSQFKISNCIFGYEAEAVFYIKPLFTTFSFMQEHINIDLNKPYIVGAEYSY